jgi:hypothetical protein
LPAGEVAADEGSRPTVQREPALQQLNGTRLRLACGHDPMRLEAATRDRQESSRISAVRIADDRYLRDR